MNLNTAKQLAQQSGVRVEKLHDGSFIVGTILVHHLPGGKACWTFNGNSLRPDYIGVTIAAAVKIEAQRFEAIRVECEKPVPLGS